MSGCQIDLQNYAKHQNKLYCTHHYFESFLKSGFNDFMAVPPVPPRGGGGEVANEPLTGGAKLKTGRQNPIPSVEAPFEAGKFYLHLGCAGRRTVQRGRLTCKSCRGRFKRCHDNYGYRNTGTGRWEAGPCPADLNCSPESPNDSWCTAECERQDGSSRSDAHVTPISPPRDIVSGDPPDAGNTSSRHHRCHPGCAALRPQQHGNNTCKFCGGKFRHCRGEYGHRENHGTGKWISGPCPADLNCSPESPNHSWCTEECERLDGCTSRDADADADANTGTAVKVATTPTHPGCAALRLTQHGNLVCKYCRGQFKKCWGEYGHKGNNGTGRWESGPCPADLSHSPESPNSFWCTADCERLEYERLGVFHATPSEGGVTAAPSFTELQAKLARRRLLNGESMGPAAVADASSEKQLPRPWKTAVASANIALESSHRQQREYGELPRPRSKGRTERKSKQSWESANIPLLPDSCVMLYRQGDRVRTSYGGEAIVEYVRRDDSTNTVTYDIRYADSGDLDSGLPPEFLEAVVPSRVLIPEVGDYVERQLSEGSVAILQTVIKRMPDCEAVVKAALLAIKQAVESKNISASDKHILKDQLLNSQTYSKKIFEKLPSEAKKALSEELNSRYIVGDCKICCCENVPLKRVSISCRHSEVLCQDCISQYIDTRMNTRSSAKEIICPECRVCILPEEILVHSKGNSVMHSRVERFLLREALREDPSFKDCANEGCLSGGYFDSWASYIVCMECSSSTCIRHGVLWHSGISCEEYDLSLGQSADDGILKYLEENGGRQCPTCGNGIQKVDVGDCDALACCQYGNDACLKNRKKPEGCDHGGRNYW